MQKYLEILVITKYRLKVLEQHFKNLLFICNRKTQVWGM